MANKSTSPSLSPRLVPVEKLRRATKLSASLKSSTSTDLFLGQDRARNAAQLAASMRAKGFNLFVAAPPGTRARPAIHGLLASESVKRTPPSDWVYVYNFVNPHAPRAIQLPPGKAKVFRASVLDLITDLRAAIPTAFDKPDVQAQRLALEDAFKERQENAFEALGEEASALGVAIIRTPMGFTLAPMKDDRVLKPEELKALSKEEQHSRQAAVETAQSKLEAVLRQEPKWERELRDGMRKLERETVETAITQSINLAKRELQDYPETCEHLDAVRNDLLDNVSMYSALASSDAPDPSINMMGDASLGIFDRYDVNIFVDHSSTKSGAPVVEESHPTLAHLIGRVEHRAEEGVLTTSFKLIKPGALHTANGGFLILDSRRILSEPMSWQALKRALQTGCIKTESLAEALSLTSTITLEPAPIPLDVKIILVGDAWIYHLLVARDPEFSEHFKLLADFDADGIRTDRTENDFAISLRAEADAKGLLEPNTAALERLIEQAAREADDAERVSLATDKLLDILTEANHRALLAERTHIDGIDIDAAITAHYERLGRIQDRMQEHLMRNISLVETQGSAVGQINGLSVFQFGDHRFGKPSRITARTRPGQGKVIDIEREARLGGPIHSKGVMILTGYLSGRYAQDTPMSLLASLVLEQSYGGVEGDSASMAELAALLSSLSDIAIKQSLAITGAVNQLGAIQAIGGVNEKVEGFFDLCQARGLTGEQGVIIPVSNIQHLMLRPDVVEACDAGNFLVFSAENVEDAIELLTGRPAREIHNRVEARLSKFASIYSGINSGDGSQPEKVTTSTPNGRPPDAPPSDPPRQPPEQSHDTPILASDE